MAHFSLNWHMAFDHNCIFLFYFYYMLATGRPCVFSFWHGSSVYVRLSALLRGDVKSTCVCLRLREQCLRSIKTSVSRVAHVLLLRSIAGYRGSEYACAQALRVYRKRSDWSKALRNPQKVDMCVPASTSCREIRRNASMYVCTCYIADTGWCIVTNI